MKMTLLEIEGALERLHTTFRRLVLTDCVMYFCESPKGVTFTLSLDSNDTLRIWRFLPLIIPDDSKVTKLERQFEDHLVGLEATEDQLFNFYIHQDLEAVPEEHRQEQVLRRIAGFLLTSHRIQERFLSLGLQPADFGRLDDTDDE